MANAPLSGAAGYAPAALPFSAEDSHARAMVQSRITVRSETPKTARRHPGALDEAEKNGSRVKPEYGSVWYDMNGPDQEHAHVHVTIAVPAATAQSTGLPDSPKRGGAWLMNAGTSTAHIMTPGT